MTNDEEFVRSHWSEPSKVYDPQQVLRCSNWLPSWAAAAAFTRDRLEDIRQVENQYALLGADNVRTMREVEAFSHVSNCKMASECAVEWVRRALVMGVLENKLFELRFGMRPA